ECPRLPVAGRLFADRFAFTQAATRLAETLRQDSPQQGIRWLAPEQATGLTAPIVILAHLTETSFPRIRSAASALEDLAAEQALFRDLIGCCTQQLILSYPATDPRGQQLLPSSFLSDLIRRFPTGSIPTTRQRMLTDRYAVGTLSTAAEERIAVARTIAAAESTPKPTLISKSQLRWLHEAKQLNFARSRFKKCGPYDGKLTHPATLNRLAEQTTTNRPWSPTALETYITCPFRYWLQHLLRIQPLENPSDELEATRRGAATHRGLARFHAALRDRMAEPCDDAELQKYLLGTMQEYAERASSPALRKLWMLEGQRLIRSLRRYRHDWESFRETWQEQGITPAPYKLELGFGLGPHPNPTAPDDGPALELRLPNSVFRLHGRIDRIDQALLPDGSTGYWIIDYKTGSDAAYGARAVAELEKLQLALYALAVEELFLKKARPLGLLYWFLQKDGPRLVFPAKPRGKTKAVTLQLFENPEVWPSYRQTLLGWVEQLLQEIHAGNFSLLPRADDCSQRCGYGLACRISSARRDEKIRPLSLPVLPNH
ncbi:MAG: PD-(D/E)XK nuclease family protein, partial [Gemmataceae bacterium]